MGPDFSPLLPEAGWSLLAGVMVALVVVPVAAVLLGTIIGILRHRRNRALAASPELPAVTAGPIESQLVEIDDLLAAGRIDQDEYAAMRARILDLR